MTDLIFGVEPPKVQRQAPPSEISETFAKLRAVPGEWAIIRTSTNKNTLNSYASNIKSGVHRGNSKGDFDAKVGPLPDEMQDEYDVEGNLVTKYGVWARFNDPELAASEPGTVEVSTDL